MTQEAKAISFRRLYALLYPFTAAAVAINLFMLALMGQAIGLPALSPVAALILCLPMGVPLNWLVTRWVRGLMDKADRTS
jgi:predicted membrane metal-binding protein